MLRKRFGLRFGFDKVLGQHLAQHQMGIGAAETESGYTGNGMSAVAGPIGGGFDHSQPNGVEVDVGVWSRVVDRRRNLVVVQCQSDLGQARRTGGRFQVAHIGFDRTEQCRVIGAAASSYDAAERISFNRVTQDCAGAVRLNVVHGARVDAGVAIGPAQHVGLGIGIRGQ